jgi:hypothetical protein
MSSPPLARPRNPALVVVDIIAGILFIVFGAALALGVVVSAASYGNLHASCLPGEANGLVCNSTMLGGAVIGMIAIAIVAFFLGLGFFAVAIFRKRYGFFWPLGAIIITVGVFYLGTWLASLTAP